MFRNALGQLLRLFGTGEPQLDYTGDVMRDVFSAAVLDHAGQAIFRADPDQLPPGTQPPNYPNLDHELPAVVKIDHSTGFQKPGDTGPNGGYSLDVRGPCNFTPNRNGDMVIDAPFGGIGAQQLYQGGVPIPPPIEIPDTGTWIVIYEDGVPTLIEGEEC